MTVTRVLTLAALLVSLPAGAHAQEAELRRRHAEKLKKPFLQRNGWETDYDEALKRARAVGPVDTVVFAYFTRSDGT